MLIWSSEDGYKDTILPRFIAAGGDKRRLYPVPKVETANGETRPFDPAIDMGALMEAARELPNLMAVMIDPIVMASAADSRMNAETRRGLQPVIDLAEDCGAAIIGITHFTKNTQGKSLIERITGSLAYGALPRVVFGTVAKDDDDNAPRRFIRIAWNIGPKGGGFEYTLTARDATGIQQHREGATCRMGRRAARRSAKKAVRWSWRTVATAQHLQRWWQGIFAREPRTQRHMVLISELKAAAAAHSLKWPTVEKARQGMGNIETCQRPGGNGVANWAWRMREN